MTSSVPTVVPAVAPTSGRALAQRLAPEPQRDLAFRGTLWPEAEFVLLGARTRLEGAHLARWEKLLGAALDWNAVLALARAHRTTGLLGRHLSARAWRGVPSSVARQLQGYFMGVTLHSGALKHELARVSHRLEAAGVAVVSFKGPTLGLGAYGNSVVRPSADLDLLVARADVTRARELLVEVGYTPELALSPAHIALALRVDSVFNFFRPAPPALRNLMPKGYAVELHWAITSPCLPFDLEYQTVAPHLSWIELPGVTARSVTGDDQSDDQGGEQGFRVRALPGEDLLLILCVHGAKHLWERLIWLCDLAELVEATPDLNWPRVLELARERGVQRMTALGLTLMRDVLGTALPREVENWISTQPEALRLATTLRRQLLVAASADQSQTPNCAGTADRSRGANQSGAAEILRENRLAGHSVSADALLIQTIDARRDRLGFLWHLATVPTQGERAALNLPAHLDFLWRVLRPARALRKRLFPLAG